MILNKVLKLLKLPGFCLLVLTVKWGQQYLPHRAVMKMTKRDNSHKALGMVLNESYGMNIITRSTLAKQWSPVNLHFCVLKKGVWRPLSIPRLPRGEMTG